MNLVMTKSSQSRLNVGWKPFATSTPLKGVPNNADFEKKSLKQLQICIDSFDSRNLQNCYTPTNVTVNKTVNLKQLVTKRSRKSKSCANFDFSSSDEDNSSEKKIRPIIKLSHKKQTNLLLMNKKSSEGDITSLKNNNTNCNHIVGCTKANKCEENNTFDVKDLKQNYDNTCYSMKKKQNNTIKLSLDNLNSDDESQIFDKVLGTCNLISDIKLSSKSKENTSKYYKGTKKFKNLGNSKFKINKSEKTANNQKTHSFTKSESQLLKSLQKTNFENLELLEVNKRKCLNSKNIAKIARNKKAKNKLATPSLNRFENNEVSPLHILENKTNLSHQLFSDSKEQELINILDLTSEDIIQGKESKARFLRQKEQKLACDSPILPYLSDHIKNFENQKVRPQRKHNLKKYWLTENKVLPATNAEKQSAVKSNFEILKKNVEYMQKPQLLKKTEDRDLFFGKFYFEGPTENNSEKSTISCQKTGRKTKNKIVGKREKKKETFVFNSATKNINKIGLNNIDAHDVQSSLDSFDETSKNSELNKPFQPVEVEIKTTVEKPVFKLINEISYNEDETGCSAAECWNINTFKCGVFKLKAKSQVSCRTMHINSHLGGVLINGKLRMKIGSREFDLNQGDMTFVPPLTEWHATNIGECESLFYYWCGRFKI